MEHYFYGSFIDDSHLNNGIIEYIITNNFEVHKLRVSCEIIIDTLQDNNIYVNSVNSKPIKCLNSGRKSYDVFNENNNDFTSEIDKYYLIAAAKTLNDSYDNLLIKRHSQNDIWSLVNGGTDNLYFNSYYNSIADEVIIQII